MLDLDAYLERIGLKATPTPTAHEVHSAHAATIPFENIDPHRGIPVSLDPGDLEGKLVHARRGGYCFEQNLLLKAGLEGIGAEVEMHLARVRLGAPPGAFRPRGHLVLHVRTPDGGDWLGDVGFGMGTQPDLHPWALGVESEQAGWRYRLVEEGPEWVLQTIVEGEWADVHSFLPHPVPMVDLETANWFVCTHPGSPFVTGLIVGRQDASGRRWLLNDWAGELTMRESTPQEQTIAAVARERIPELLEERFGLHGFELDEAGRVRPAGR